MDKKIEKINIFVVDTNITKLKNNITNLNQGEYSAVILDIKNNDFAVSDLPLLIELFGQKQFIVIGIRSDNNELKEFAKFSNLAIFSTITDIEEAKVKPMTTYPQKLFSIIRGNTHKNEQVYAKNCDLVIIDNLSENSEAMSDENITIYGGGYGSAFAGINNPNAFIFINYFQLKLVCINGVYKKFNKVPSNLLNKSIVVTLNDGKLCFKIL